jgi:hypothetical protein
MRSLITMCGALAIVACLAPGAHADEWNKKTFLTFSAPVQIPGATLPAGTYTFELANPDTSRHVIRVSEKDSGKPIGLFMTIPQDRLDPPNDNLIMFAERPAGAAQAIQAWYYPGDRIGEEFVYPKAQAMQIAKANRVGVLATEGGGVANVSDPDRVAALRSASVGRVDESGRMSSDTTTATTTAQATTTARPRTTTAQATTAERAQANPPATTAPRAQTNPSTTGTTGTTSNAASRRRELPRTASNLVALELLSGLAIAGGLIVRRVRLARAK